MQSQLPISVCMPMYNASRYLRECIDSILSQTFTDFELLIVDDGSEDDSIAIVESYTDPRIRLIRNRHDYIGSLNLLLKEARGKYIARMDADDVMLPYRLQVQYDYMELNPNVDVLGTSANILNSNDSVVYEEERFISLQDLLLFSPLVHPTTMIRSQSIRKHALEYEVEYLYSEDYRLWCRMAMLQCRIAVIPVVTILYRRSGNQLTSRCYEQMQKVAEKVRADFTKWLCFNSNKGYKTPHIPFSDKEVTVIIPFLNEGLEVVETVKSIRQHVQDRVEIIVINDFSTDEVDYASLLSPYKVYYFINTTRMGVAASRDKGVMLCKTPYFVLLDAHMRVYNDAWLPEIVKLLSHNDRQVLCAQTEQLWKEDGNIITLDDATPVYGAYLTFNRHSLVPNIEWNYIESHDSIHFQRILAILGAGYAASKRYWQYLKGLEGLQLFGCDEAYISLKVWLEGGQCILMKNHRFGHIYRKKAPYRVATASYVYNHLFIAYTLFPVHLWCWSLASCKCSNPIAFRESIKLINTHKKQLRKYKLWYKHIQTVSFETVYHRNYQLSLQAVKDIDKRIQIAHQINIDDILESVYNCGIIDGKCAWLIWLTHKSKIDSNISKYQLNCAALITEINDAVVNHRLPWNFYHGLCGIGWCLIYLYTEKLVIDPNEEILQCIDTEIQQLDLKRITDYSFDYGLGGILAYVTCRYVNQKHNKKDFHFSDNFINNLRSQARKVLEINCNHTSTYYAYLLLHIKEIINEQQYNPQIEEWLKYPTDIPNNPKYWDYTLYNGCLGYSLLGMKAKRALTK